MSLSVPMLRAACRTTKSKLTAAVRAPTFHRHMSMKPVARTSAPSTSRSELPHLAGGAYIILIYPQGWASSVTPHSTASDPAEAEALRCLEQGTAKLEEGDVQAAKSLYQRSTEIKRSASSLFNLGVTHYHLSECYFIPATPSLMSA